MPPWGIVRRIDASHHDPATAYMAVDYHLVDNRDPYLYKTADFGQTWTRIDAGLPKGHPLDYALSIAENPRRRGMIFAGTGHAFFYSLDDGKTWTQFKDKLPAAPVNWIEVPKNAAEVAVATYGRGLWILRDIWQLEQPAHGGQAAQAPRTICSSTSRVPGMRTAGGGSATFVFAMRAAPTAPITMEILSRLAAVISTSQVQGRAGMNQASWNLLLAGAGPAGAALDSARQPAHLGGRPLAGPRAAGHALGPRRARIAAARRAGQVHRAPDATTAGSTRSRSRSGGTRRCTSTDADLVASTDLQVKVVAAINEVVDKINRIEIMRMQVEDLRKAHAGDKALDKALAAIYKRMYDTELHYLSRTEMHSDDKWYVEKYKLYMNLIWLLAEIGGGGGDVDGRRSATGRRTRR